MNKSEMLRGLGVPFDRLRRITGYLVPNLERWNNGKKAEYNDRVKHSVNFTVELDKNK